MNSTSDSSASTVSSWPLESLTFVISPVLTSASPLCRVRRSYHLGYFFFAEFFFAFFTAGFFFAFFAAGFFSRRRVDFSPSISSNHSTRVLATRRNVTLRDGDRVAIPTCAAFFESSSPSEARAKNIFSMPPSMHVQLLHRTPSSTFYLHDMNR